MTDIKAVRDKLNEIILESQPAWDEAKPWPNRIAELAKEALAHLDAIENAQAIKVNVVALEPIISDDAAKAYAEGRFFSPTPENTPTESVKRPHTDGTDDYRRSDPAAQSPADDKIRSRTNQNAICTEKPSKTPFNCQEDATQRTEIVGAEFTDEEGNTHILYRGRWFISDRGDETGTGQPVECREAFDARYNYPERDEHGHYISDHMEDKYIDFAMGWQSRPMPESITPTEDMCDKARGFIMGLDLRIRTWKSMQDHLDAGGYPTLPYIREKSLNEPEGHITKWDVAECIYVLMNQIEVEPSDVG